MFKNLNSRFLNRFLRVYRKGGIKDVTVSLSKFRRSRYGIFFDTVFVFYLFFLYRRLYYADIADVEEETNDQKTYFKDIIGIEEYKADVLEIVDCLKNAKDYEKIGANVPKGVLLHGKPGTGKTMLAKAMANESGVKFFYKSGSEFEGKYVGSGSNKIKELFEKARKQSPSIIFIDEIDSIGGKRDTEGIMGSSDALNQLLTEMDGFTKNENVIVIGATNRLRSLDDALLRPGRFDKIVTIPIPSDKSRKKILDHYLNKVVLSGELNREKLVGDTKGFTGAELKNLVNLAALRAVEKELKGVGDEELKYAFDRITLGNKRNEEEQEAKLRLAYGEAGMAVTALLAGQGASLRKISLLRRKNKGNKNPLVSGELSGIYTQNLINQRIQVLMGCRASEELFYKGGEMSLRCGDQMKAATALSYKLERDFGNKTIMMTGQGGSERRRAEEDRRVDSRLLSLYRSTLGMLKENRDSVKRVALELFHKGSLTVKEVHRLRGRW